MLQGVPALDPWVDMTHATAWGIANDPKPIAAHMDHTAVA